MGVRQQPLALVCNGQRRVVAGQARRKAPLHVTTNRVGELRVQLRNAKKSIISINEQC